jgi:glutamate synthase domain-containing protein 2
VSVLGWIGVGVLAGVVVVAVYDLVQRRHAVLHNFPVIGHLRYLLEAVGPELRQYIVTDNNQERPFDRDQRRWIYASAKRESNMFSFGTDNEVELTPNYLVVDQAAFPLPRPRPDEDVVPCAKVLGAARDRKARFRPASIVNVSAMSYGALSPAATEAVDRGCAIAGCLHNVGEGGIAPEHGHGADLVFQVGTGYFGCRDASGRFDLARLVDLVAEHPVRAIEVKLSQGAKPALGGMLPASKVTPAIAALRGVPAGRDCVSPASHREFHDVDGMLDFVERVADATGLPVGIKSAVGGGEFWDELAVLMATTDRGVDFVTVDGGEGGTGEAPLAFSDHVALPFKVAMGRVYAAFARQGIADRVVFIGSGRLGLPDRALLAFALGCDLVNVAREAMFALGCIQAQRCHTGRCPTGVATQSRWLTRGLDPALKSVRVANYVATLRLELLQLARACGVVHPALVGADRLEILDGHFGARTVGRVFGYEPGWGLPGPAEQAAITEIMRGLEHAEAG